MDRGGCRTKPAVFARKRTSLDSLAVSCSKSCLCVHKCILTSLRWTKKGEVMNIFVKIFSSMLPRDEGRGSDVYIKSYLGHPRFLSATEYIFYCKRAILFLSSSKILTPHPPLPPLLRGEDRHAGRRGGWEVNILEDERNRIALLQ